MIAVKLEEPDRHETHQNCLDAAVKTKRALAFFFFMWVLLKCSSAEHIHQRVPAHFTEEESRNKSTNGNITGNLQGAESNNSTIEGTSCQSRNQLSDGATAWRKKGGFQPRSENLNRVCFPNLIQESYFKDGELSEQRLDPQKIFSQIQEQLNHHQGNMKDAMEPDQLKGLRSGVT